MLYKNVVNKYRALAFIIIYKGDVDALLREVFEAYGVVGPFARHGFGGCAGSLPLVVDHGAFGADAVDDGGGELGIFLLAGPDDDFQHVVGGGEIALRLEFEHAEAVGDINLVAHHPVVARAGGGVHGVGAGSEVGAFFIVAHKAPRIVVGIGEAPSLHGGGGGEVVSLPEHEVDETVREILVEERAVVERNLALVKSVEVERDAVGGVVARHVGHGSLRNADAVVHAFVELQGGGGVDEDLIVLGGEIELLVSLCLALAIYFGSRALCGHHLRVESEDEGVGVGVDAQHGGPVLRRAGRERYGRIGAADEGDVNLIVGAF